jgi:hypothetical protein
MTSPQRAVEVAAGITVPAWIVTMAANALPIIQTVAGILAGIASFLAICVYLRTLRRKA